MHSRTYASGGITGRDIVINHREMNLVAFILFSKVS